MILPFCAAFQLKLDGKHIGNREFWKRQVVVTRRKSQPASYGFYSPAREEADDEGSFNRKKVNDRDFNYSLFTYIDIYNVFVTSGPFLLSDTLTLNPKHGEHISKTIKGCSYCSMERIFEKHREDIHLILYVLF